MKKRGIALLLVCVLLLTLTACKNDTIGDGTLNNNPPAAPTNQAPTDAPDEGVGYEGHPWEEEGKDPVGELPDDTGNVDGGTPIVAGNPGATPVPLDPIDKPATPTPEPLTFTYAEYEVDALNIKFKGPSNTGSIPWTRTDAGNSVILTEETERNGTQATIEITMESLNLTLAELKEYLSNQLDLIGEGYATWQPYTIEDKTLFKKDGVYTNYRGVQADGTIVRGRIHVVVLDGTLYTLHLRHSAYSNEDYLKNYNEIRSSLSLMN